MKPEIQEFENWAKSSIGYLRRLNFSEKNILEFSQALEKIVQRENEMHKAEIERKRILQKMKSEIASMSPKELESVPLYLVLRFQNE